MGFMDSLKNTEGQFTGQNTDVDAHDHTEVVASPLNAEKENAVAGAVQETAVFEERPEEGGSNFAGATEQITDIDETHSESAQSTIGNSLVAPMAGAEVVGRNSGAYAGAGPESHKDQSAPALSNSHISEDTEIVGNVNSGGNIEIRGKVMGDVNTKGNIIVEGGIFGDVAGQNVGLYNCKIKGDVKAVVDVMGDAGTVVLGNLNANNIVMDGKCKGVVEADNMLVIRGNAYLIGDISARSFVVDDGAVINGSIKTITNENLDALFNINEGDL